MKCHDCGTEAGVRKLRHLYPGGAVHISLTRATNLCPACERKKAESYKGTIEAAKQQIKAHQQAKDEMPDICQECPENDCCNRRPDMWKCNDEGQVALQLDGTLEIEQEQTEMDLGALPEVPNPMVRKHGAGPAGKKCKTCAFLCTIQPGQNTYYKCEKRGITHGPGTDHRVRWDACSKYEEEQAWETN